MKNTRESETPSKLYQSLLTQNWTTKYGYGISQTYMVSVATILCMQEYSC